MTRDPFAGLRPVIGKGMQRLRMAYIAADPHEKRLIESAADMMRATLTQGETPLLDPPSGSEADGEVWLGRILHGPGHRLGWAGVDRNQMTRHLGVFGTTGAGKTTLCASVLLRLMELGTPWIAVDPKRSLRCLSAMPTPNPVRVLTTGRAVGTPLRFNPLSPPSGDDPAAHAAEVVQLLCDTWTGGAGIASLFDKVIRSILSTGEQPTLDGMLRVLNQSSPKGREGTWLQSARRILETVVHGRLRRVFSDGGNSATAADEFPGILGRWTIIETDGLTREEASFLVSTLLLRIHGHLLAQPTRERLRLAVLVDEAEQLLVRRDATRESLLDRLIRTSRESSLGLIVASQSISRMTPVILANLGTLVAMRAHHRDDVGSAARMLMMPEYATPMIGTLGIGQAICRVPGWRSPMHIEVPRLQLPKGAVSDETLQRNGTPNHGAAVQAGENSPEPEVKRDPIFEAIDAVCGGATWNSGASSVEGSADSSGSGGSTPLSGREPGQAGITEVPLEESAWSHPREHACENEISGEDDARSAVGVTPDRVASGSDLDAEQAALLKHIATHPFLSVTERYAQLQMSRRRGNRARKALERDQWVFPRRVRTERGVRLLLELSDRANRWLARHHTTAAPVHGGLLHGFWAHESARRLKEHGWHVTTEARDSSGKVCDVEAVRGDDRLLLQIETGKSDWRGNAAMLAKSTASHAAMLWVGPELPQPAHRPGGPSIEWIEPSGLNPWLHRLDNMDNDPE